MDSYTSEKIRPSDYREYISRVSSLTRIERIVYIVAFSNMGTMGAILWKSHIICICYPWAIEQEVTIQALFNSISIRYEIAVFRFPVSIYKITIFLIKIGIIESWMRDPTNNRIILIAHSSSRIYIFSSSHRIPLFFPPFWLRVYDILRSLWKCRDNRSSCFGTYSFGEIKIISPLKSSSFSLLRTEGR